MSKETKGSKGRMNRLAVVRPPKVDLAAGNRAASMLRWLSDGKLDCRFSPGTYDDGDREGTEGRIIYVRHDIDTEPDLSICLRDGDPVPLILEKLEEAARYYQILAGEIAIAAVKAGKVGAA